MNRMIWLAACCFGLTMFKVTPARAQNPDDSGNEAVRTAVSRSLVFLEREGVAWMQERGCMSCHHVPFLLWTHRAAQSHAITVDATKLAEWDEWARHDSLSHRNLYRLQTYELDKVEVAKLPEAVREKLKPLIEEPFKTESEFVAKLAELLNEEEQASYREIILKTAERTPYSVDRAGGGLDVLGQLLLGDQRAERDVSQSEFRRGAIELMNGIQLEDGSWTPGNQFATMRRWPLPAANQATTIWAALALATAEGPEMKRTAAVEKAIAHLRPQPPSPENREWLATRLLFEHQLGSAEDAAGLRQQLLEARNGDGGWGWETGVPSDSLATGLAIYVLARTGTAESLVEYRDARTLLLTTQQEDGSWLTPSKNITKSKDPERLKARDEIYHYWGTAWAAIGLLETLQPAKSRAFSTTE
jgi:squalene-hopene/tetraprenyl-beta-curcumene cyclase